MTAATKPGEFRILQSSCEQRPNTAPLTPIPGSAVAASYFKLGNFKQDDASLDSLTREIGSNHKFLNVSTKSAHVVDNQVFIYSEKLNV